MEEKKLKKPTTEEEIKCLAHIFYDNETIYDEYARMTIGHTSFRTDIKDFIIFIRNLASEGLVKDNNMRFNGISNHCTTFLLNHNLLDNEEIENIIKKGENE